MWTEVYTCVCVCVCVCIDVTGNRAVVCKLSVCVYSIISDIQIWGCTLEGLQRWTLVMKKKNCRKCKKLSTLVTLLTFVALHSGRIACCPDHMLFYIHKKHFLIATNDHFPYVWVWCDTENYASFCATSHNCSVQHTIWQMLWENLF